MPYVIQLADGTFAPKTRGQPNVKNLQSAGVWISKAAAIKQLDPRHYWERGEVSAGCPGKPIPDTGARVREVQLTFVEEI
jgi:hypothetical protein